MFLLSPAHFIPAPEAVQWSSHQHILLLRQAEKARPVRSKVENRVNSISWLQERTRLRQRNLNKYQLYGAIKTISPDLRLPQQWLWSCRFLGYESMKPDRNPTKFRSNLHLQYSPETWVKFYHITRSHTPADNSLQEYFHLSSSPHSAINIFRVIMPKSDTVVSITVRSANKYRNGFNSLEDHVSQPPRPDRLSSPLLLPSSRNLKSFLGTEQPQHKDTHSVTANIEEYVQSNLPLRTPSRSSPCYFKHRDNLTYSI